MRGVSHFFTVHVYGWWGWALPFQLWIQICLTYNDFLTGCNCLKLAALFKLKQLKTYQEIKALMWNNKTPLIFLDCKWSGHILLWLCWVWTQVDFFKEKKIKIKGTYLSAYSMPAKSINHLDQRSSHKMLHVHFPQANQHTHVPTRTVCHWQLHLQNTSVIQWRL